METVFRDSTCLASFFAYQVRAAVGYVASLWSAFLLLIWRPRFLNQCRTTVTASFILKWWSTLSGCDGMSKSKNWLTHLSMHPVLTSWPNTTEIRLSESVMHSPEAEDRTTVMYRSRFELIRIWSLTWSRTINNAKHRTWLEHNAFKSGALFCTKKYLKQE